MVSELNGTNQELFVEDATPEPPFISNTDESVDPNPVYLGIYNQVPFQDQCRYGDCTLTTDIDSICVSGTDMIGVTSAILEGNKATAIRFRSVLNRNNLNDRSRYQLKCSAERNFQPTRFGKKMGTVNLEMYKNFDLLSILTDKLEFHVILYFIDPERQPCNKMLTDMQLSVLAAALNAAKRECADGTQYNSGVTNTCSRVNTFTTAGSTREDKAKQNSTTGTLPKAAAIAFIASFRHHLLMMSDEETFEIAYDTIAYHGTKNHRDVRDLRQKMIKTANEMNRQLFVHAQAVGIKTLFPNFTGLNGHLLNPTRLNEIAYDGFFQAKHYLLTQVLRPPEPHNPNPEVVYLVDMALNLTPTHPEMSFIPNGDVGAEYLVQLVAGQPTVPEDYGAENPVRYHDECSTPVNRHPDTREQSYVAPPEEESDPEESFVAPVEYQHPADPEDEPEYDEAPPLDSEFLNLHEVGRLLNNNLRDLVELGDVANHDVSHQDDSDSQESVPEVYEVSQYVEDLTAMRQGSRYVYPQFCSNGILGNSHTHKVVLNAKWTHANDPEFYGEGQLSMEKGRYATTSAGGQVYQSHTRIAGQKMVQKSFYQTLPLLGIHMENLLKGHPEPSLQLIPDDFSAALVRSTLEEVEAIVSGIEADTIHSRVGSIPTRFEIFHLSDDLDMEYTPVISVPFHSIINVCKTSHLCQLYHRILRDAVNPLLHTFANQGGGSVGQPLSSLSSAAKVSLMYHAELLALALEVPAYAKPILDQFKPARGNPLVRQVPPDQRTSLSSLETERTGLRYGLQPRLLQLRRTIHTNTDNRSYQDLLLRDDRFNMYCANLAPKVRNIRKYTESETHLMQAFRSWGGNSGLGLAPDVDESDGTCVFEEPDYVALKTLSEVQRRDLYAVLCRILMELYREEWGYIVSQKTVKHCRRKNRRHRPRVALVPLKMEEVPCDLFSLGSVRREFESFLSCMTSNRPKFLDRRGFVTSIGKRVAPPATMVVFLCEII